MSAADRRSKPAGGRLTAERADGAWGSLVAVGSPAGFAVIATTVLASMVGFLNASVINVAVPAIGRDLHGASAPSSGP